MDFDFLCALPSAQMIHVEVGTPLVRQGDAVQHIFVLKNGICERVEVNDAGEEILYNTKSAEDGIEAVVGINNLWHPEGISLSTFVAKTPLDCVRVDAFEAKSAICQRPAILDAIIEKNMRNYLHLHAMYHSRRERRTANLLCTNILRHAVSTEDGTLALPKKITNVFLSRQLGVHPVTIANIMSALQKENVIERTKDGVVIRNRTRLQDYADGEKLEV